MSPKNNSDALINIQQDIYNTTDYINRYRTLKNIGRVALWGGLIVGAGVLAAVTGGASVLPTLAVIGNTLGTTGAAIAVAGSGLVAGGGLLAEQRYSGAESDEQKHLADLRDQRALVSGQEPLLASVLVVES